MANETILYRAATCNMGDATQRDGMNYRAWALGEIERNYPNAARVEVLNEDRGSTVYADSYQEEIDCLEFLRALWDRCPWSGPNFD